MSERERTIRTAIRTIRASIDAQKKTLATLYDQLPKEDRNPPVTQITYEGKILTSIGERRRP